MLFEHSERVVLQKAKGGHPVLKWNRNAFTFYPYQGGIPYSFERIEDGTEHDIQGKIHRVQTTIYRECSAEFSSDTKNLCMLDDAFIVKVFEDKKCLELALQVIMGIPTLDVTDYHVLDTSENARGQHIRYEVRAVDADGAQYEIKLQRVHDSEITSGTDDVGTDIDFGSLTHKYVISIGEGDMLGKGQLRYFSEWMYYSEKDKKYKPLSSGEKSIYVDAAHEDTSTELGKLMSDFRARDVEKMHFPILKERVEFLKEQLK